MPADTAFSPTRRFRPLRLATCLATVLSLGACVSAPVATSPEQPVPTVEPTKPSETAPAPPAEAAKASHAERNAGAAPGSGAPETLSAVMGYADRLRGLQSSELLQELNALGDPGATPARQMQAALVLMQLRQTTASARALALLQRVVAHPGPESAPFKPLAQLLAQLQTISLSDQRRLEDTVDRQAQQLRDSQRRIDMLNDRLEAMRDIERSLTPRPSPRGAGRPPNP